MKPEEIDYRMAVDSAPVFEAFPGPPEGEAGDLQEQRRGRGHALSDLAKTRRFDGSQACR
jgi:hypothetical protein